MCMSMHIYRHPFQGVVRPCRGRGLPGHSQSLTVPVEVGYLLGAAMASPKSDFPQQRLGSSHLPPAQSGSDCAQQVRRFPIFF